jgi:hypothetical protein
MGSSLATKPTRILVADRNVLGSQLLAESSDRDPTFEAFAVAFGASAGDIVNAVSARRPDVAVISADFDGGLKKGFESRCPRHYF